MRRTNVLAAAVMAMSLLAAGASPGRAATLSGGAFSGSSSAYGTRAFVFEVGVRTQLRCDAAVSGTGGSTQPALAMTFSGCLLRITTPPVPMTASPTTWSVDLAPATYYGPWWGSGDLVSTTPLTFSVGPCSITFPSGALTASVDGENTGFPLSGTSMFFDGSNLSHTLSGCPGMPTASTNGSVHGALDVTGAWVDP